MQRFAPRELGRADSSAMLKALLEALVQYSVLDKQTISGLNQYKQALSGLMRDGLYCI